MIAKIQVKPDLTPLYESPVLSASAGWYAIFDVSIYAVEESNIFSSRVLIKHEHLHPGGSSLVRGISTYVEAALAGSPARERSHFWCAGLRAGLACAFVCQKQDRPYSVVVPTSTSMENQKRLWRMGVSELVVQGANWREADAHLRSMLWKDSVNLQWHNPEVVYVPPAHHPEISKGSASLLDELREQCRMLYDIETVDAVVCSVADGWSLFSGIMLAAQNSAMNMVVVTVQREGPLVTPQLSGHRPNLMASPSDDGRSVKRVTALVESYKDTFSGLGTVHSSITHSEATRACVQMHDHENIQLDVEDGACVATCLPVPLTRVLPGPLSGEDVIIVILDSVGES